MILLLELGEPSPLLPVAPIGSCVCSQGGESRSTLIEGIGILLRLDDILGTPDEVDASPTECNRSSELGAR